MTYDMRPLNCDDAIYSRIVYGKEVTSAVADVVAGIKTLKSDFNNGRCSNGILYDYDYGIAFAITENVKMSETDFTLVVIDQDVSVELFVSNIEAKIVSKEI